MTKADVVRVFAAGARGGNPAPIVVDAGGMSDTDMQEVARAHELESGFVSEGSEGCDFTLRFFVPNHEMEICGHATIGAVWLLDHLGRLPGSKISLATRSGIVEARVERNGSGRNVEITQPAGSTEALDATATADIASVLGIAGTDLAPLPMRNARTSRTKTLVPLASPFVLDALSPDLSRIEAVCDRIGSTGLYPFAIVDADAQVFSARQFPKSSGYPEDAATGIAAAALAFGLLEEGLVQPNDRPILIHQGIAMGKPSEITVRFRLDGNRVIGCWLGGKVELEAS